MPAATKRRESGHRKGSAWKTGLVPLVVIVAHNIPHANAFSSESHRRSATGLGVHSPKRQQQYRLLPAPGVGQQSWQQSSRFRTSSSKFFVASTTGRPLNGDNEKNGFFSSEGEGEEEEEIPWECIVDPRGCDAHYQNQLTEGGGGGWTKKEDEDRVTLKDKVSMGATFVSAVMVFAFLIMKSGPGSWRFFLAGGLCAALSHAIPTPLDVVKVRISSNK